MNNQQFFEKVSQMRKQQKTYQEAKPSSQESRDALIASKRLETEIDQEIARVQSLPRKTSSWFSIRTWTEASQAAW